MIRKRTLANLSSLPMEQVEMLRRVLRGETLVPADEAFEILRAQPHGHVAAVLGTLRKLGLAYRRPKAIDVYCPGGDVRDVGDPEPVGTYHRKVPLNQIGRLLTLVVLDGGAGSLPSADALQARLTHQAGHPLATHPDAALSLEFGMDPGRAVGASGVLVNRSHPLQKHRILPRPLRPA